MTTLMTTSCAAHRLPAARPEHRPVRPELADHQDRPRGRVAAVVRGGARHPVGDDGLRPAGLPRPPGLAAARRLADRPVGRRAAARLLLRLLQPRPAEPAGRPLERARLHRVAVGRAAVAADRREGRLARRRSACCWAWPASSSWPIRRASTGTTGRGLGPCLAAAVGPHLGDRHRPYPPPPLAARAARRAALADERRRRAALDRGAARRARTAISTSTPRSSGSA